MKKAIKGVFDVSFIFNVFILIMFLYVGASFVGIRNSNWSDIPLLDYIKRSSNFVPFKTINTYIESMFNGRSNVRIPVKTLLGDLIIYLQMGFSLPYFIKKLNKVRRFVFSITALLFIIEVTQLVTRRGNFDIDDLILNILSALLGYAIWKNKRVQKLIRKWT